MITINNVLIDNFRGFERNIKFSIGDAKLVLLNAPNGTGKTTLLDAIEWCLTGKIGRIQVAYERRLAKSDQKLEYNSKAILKNKNRPNENTRVELKLTCEQKQYRVIREQEKDTLQQSGIVRVVDLDDVEVDNSIINKWVKEDTFYQYHIFDMQKVYNLLSKKKDEVQNLFSDFTKQYTEADTVISNLGLFVNDIDIKIDKIEKQQTSDKDIAQMQEKLTKSVVSPENLQYEKKLLYDDENLEVENMSINELNKQLEKLYCCGYIYLKELILKVNSSSEAKRIDSHLNKIKQEIEKDPEIIKSFIEKRYFEKSKYQELTKKIVEYKSIILTEDNIEKKAENIVKLGMPSFSKVYWESKKAELLIADEIRSNVEKEVNVLTRGNDVLKMITSLIENKQFILDYRDEIKGKGNKIKCPVCGSDDRFGIIQDDDVLYDAQKYIEDYNALLKEKTVDLKEKNEIASSLRKELLLKAIEAVELKNKEVNKLMLEYEQYNKKCSEYAEAIEELKKINSREYTYTLLDSKEKIISAIQKNAKQIIFTNELTESVEKIKEVSEIISFPLLEPYTNNTVRAVENRINDELVLKEFSIGLLSKKIDAIKNFKKNDEFLDLKNKLDNSIKSVGEIKKEIDDLINQKKLATDKIRRIKEIKQELEMAEYVNIGPFLTKIFHKLSKDIHIKNILLEKRAGEKNEKDLELCDEDNRPIMNMLSDGQLSVFMLSYFLGNAFRLSTIEEMSIYLMDDITSCLDDINMLSFLDLLKYQLNNENGVFDQIFFASCNNRIQALMEWKAQACEISYKKITINDYSIE